MIPIDDFEKTTLDILDKDMKNKDVDTVYGIFPEGVFLMYNTYAKRTFKYDDWGNVEKICYYRANDECIMIIKEDILEDGFVPESEAYLVNSNKQIFPYHSNYYVNRKNEDVLSGCCTMKSRHGRAEKVMF